MNTTKVVAQPQPPHTFLDRFTVLIGAVRELWIVFGAKFLAILAYGLMNSTIVLWLSSDLGYDDAHAGYLVAYWSAILTLCTVLVGSLVDAIGLRKAFLIGFGICVISRGFMAFSGARWLALPFGLFLVAVGEALLTPVLVAAVKQYTTTAQRSISYSILYAVMNLAFFFGNLIFDYMRVELGEHGHFIMPLLGVELSTYRTIFLISLAITLPNLLLIFFFLREGLEVTDTGVKIVPRLARAAAGARFKVARILLDTVRDTARIFGNLWRQPGFYKFLAFLSVVVAVRLIFYHMYYTYPKFGIRELGATATFFSAGEIRNPATFALKLKEHSDLLSAQLFNQFSEQGRATITGYPQSGLKKKALRAVILADLNRLIGSGALYQPEQFKNVKLRPPTKEALGQNPEGKGLVRLNRLLLEDAYPNFIGAGVPIGRLWSMNNLLIVFLVPVVGALTQRISAYRMVMIGSSISAASVFIMALPPHLFKTWADGLPGHLIAHVGLGVEGAVSPYYVMILLYVVVLSIGESLWSPRLYEYSTAVAPKGQEASYMSMSYLPFFVAKLFVGMFSGLLLARYCPEVGPRNSQMLWLIIALITMITPIGLLLLRPFIQAKEAGRE